MSEELSDRQLSEMLVRDLLDLADYEEEFPYWVICLAEKAIEKGWIRK